jgi:tetratricopeptide (TPR) repeat protein/DNA-binding SARP family transcriptional activator
MMRPASVVADALVEGAVVLRVGLLGPLEVSVGGRRVVLTTGRLRSLLAVLALSAGEAVSLERLVWAVWDEVVPSHDRKAVQTYVSRLRGVLGGGVIGTVPAGYVLRVERERVDVLRFVGLLDAAAGAGDVSAERGLLMEALGLWRGMPFEGVRSGWLEESEGPRLVERYLAAVERRADLDLAAGRVGGLVALLRDLVGQFPLRESLWVRWLVVLARSGRQAEALEGYEAVRVRIAEELGTDPGIELQRVYADLLAGQEPSVDGGGGLGVGRRRVPRQLPGGGGGFTGRGVVLAELLGAFAGAADPVTATAVVCVVSGMAGVGKTALAVNAARRLVDRFPDGQLYVDLHGATAGLEPSEPQDVLGWFLRALGVDPAGIPADVEEASAAFRSQVADRRLLLVLDNAVDAAQVAPLLPASPRCGVVVTSRRALVGLDGAAQVRLDVLEPDEALDLLARVAGGDRVAAEPAAAARVARLCGYLPLALRIAGARLAARPAWPVAALAQRLSDAARRLDELTLGDVGVRASFTVSYQQLEASDDFDDRAVAGAFEFLGVLDGPDMDARVVARVLDIAEHEAELVLERLVDAQLLETPAPGRYQLHDLLRLYARELAYERHDQAARAAALTRAVGFYLSTAWHTLALLWPGDHRLTRADDRWTGGGVEFVGEQAALDWLEAERANLLAVTRQAVDTPGVPAEMAVQLAQALAGFFSPRGYWDDWVAVNQLALGVARRANDRSAQAQAHNDLGLAYWMQGRFDEAQAHHEQALAMCRQVGDRYGEGVALGGLGRVCRTQGRFEQAQGYDEASLAICREVGDRRGEGESLGALGYVYQRQGRITEALACLEQSLAIRRELGDRRHEAIGLSTLGLVLQLQERYDEALACHEQALAIRRDLGDRHAQATSVADLGVVYAKQGNYDRALDSQRASLAVFQELADPHCQAEVHRQLGNTLHALGRTTQAHTHWQHALTIFERLDTTDADQVRTQLEQAASTPA